MIIVEGVDGSGKDTLIERLLKDFGHELQLGPRASDSIKGPLTNLGGWLIRDIHEWAYIETTRVYNRYPVISEPIYGPLLRGYIDPTVPQVMEACRRQLEQQALVVWCCPPLDRVTQNVSKARDMPGVEENIRTLYKHYRQSERGWIGPKVSYDYSIKGTAEGSYHSVKQAVLAHIRERNNLR